MISARWLKKRKPHWARLEELVGRSGRRGMAALAHAELQELGLLYRQTASDLATVREDAASRNLAGYLNQLLGRAHNLIYMGRRARPRGILHFYRVTYPQLFRATFVYTLTAFVLFAASAVAGFLITLGDPGFQRFLLGAPMADTIERGAMWTQSILLIKPLASSAILTNNLAVAFAAFAAGITAGVGTVYLMAVNGLLFGVLAAATWQASMSVAFFGFVTPHGALELPAIFIAGGSGLVLARGLLFPGLLARRDSLAQAGALAVRLLLGTIPLLFIAGFIEGFVSPVELPVALKFACGGLLATILFLYLYLFRAGREEPAPRAGRAP